MNLNYTAEPTSAPARHTPFHPQPSDPPADTTESYHTHKLTTRATNNILGGNQHNVARKHLRIGATTHNNHNNHNNHNHRNPHSLQIGQAALGRTIGEAETGGNPQTGAEPK